jgi:hypothetical protein
VKKQWQEPTLEDLLNDSTLDALLSRDGVSKDDLHRLVADARKALARVPRSWRDDNSPVPEGLRCAGGGFSGRGNAGVFTLNDPQNASPTTRAFVTAPRRPAGQGSGK